jgi:hypothetical protein
VICSPVFFEISDNTEVFSFCTVEGVAATGAEDSVKISRE